MCEVLEVGQALSRGRALPYAMIRALSRVTLGPTPDEIDLDELIEARFFDSEQEVRIFHGETGLQAAHLWEGTEDTVIERTYKLANNAIFGRSVTIHQLLHFDEDGQACVSCTRLAGWKGGD
ncbi:MAG: hypothetical protein HDT35_02355 [Clostridiales bacterium]|nr:hypothetical protein [Clostridiales bacterium]